MVPISTKLIDVFANDGIDVRKEVSLYAFARIAPIVNTAPTHRCDQPHRLPKNYRIGLFGPLGRKSLIYVVALASRQELFELHFHRQNECLGSIL